MPTQRAKFGSPGHGIQASTLAFIQRAAEENCMRGLGPLAPGAACRDGGQRLEMGRARSEVSRAEPALVLADRQRHCRACPPETSANLLLFSISVSHNSLDFFQPHIYRRCPVLSCPVLSCPVSPPHRQPRSPRAPQHLYRESARPQPQVCRT